MSRASILALAVVLAPAVAPAQTSYSQARIERPRLHVCAERRVSLAERKAFLDMDKAALDAEHDAITREGERLAAELPGLDKMDTNAVAIYNARTADQNRRVEAYNGRAAEMNRAAALMNGDAAEFNAYCNSLRFSKR